MITQERTGPATSWERRGLEKRQPGKTGAQGGGWDPHAWWPQDRAKSGHWPLTTCLGVGEQLLQFPQPTGGPATDSSSWGVGQACGSAPGKVSGYRGVRDNGDRAELSEGQSGHGDEMCVSNRPAVLGL